jgi:acetolactate synthase I/II/III large subunit
VRTSDLFVECLENEGVQYVFGLPGEENLQLLDSLSRSRQVRFVTTRHEQGAAFMANVYGRLSTYPGVCLSTLGPGATNLLTGVADAQLDRAPLVAITGQIALRSVFKQAHQYLDVMRLFAPVTKWNARIELAETTPEIVRKAFRLARLEKPGATHIELPEDVAAADVSATPMPVRRTTYPMARAEQIARAAELVRASTKPVILAGNGVVRRQAAAALTAFAQRLRIPVTTTFMGKGVLDARDPLALPAVGLQAAARLPAVLAAADLVIAVGYDLVEWAPSVWNATRDKTILHLDSSAAEVDHDYLPAAEVIGEIGDNLRALADEVGDRPAVLPQPAAQQPLTAALAAFAGDQSWPMQPQRIVHDLRAALADDDIVISDVGVHKLWLATRYPAARPNTLIVANGLASMGIAVPGAIAAKLVHPERKVVAVSGDGGFLMNSQELETAKRLRTPFVSLVLVDGRYGLIALNQERRFGGAFATEFGNPNFVTYAAAFGLPGFRVGSADEFLPVLRRALELDEPSIIAVPVDSSRSPADAP